MKQGRLVQLDRGPTRPHAAPREICRQIEMGARSMMRLASSALLIILCAPAHAQVTVDVAKVTCEQFLLSRDVYSFAYWLNGYYHGQRNDPVLETERFKANGKKLRAACLNSKNTKLPVMQV